MAQPYKEDNKQVSLSKDVAVGVGRPVTGAINNSALGRRLPRRTQYTPCSVEWSGPIQQPLRARRQGRADRPTELNQ